MRLLEDRLKPLLRTKGVTVPVGAIVGDEAALDEFLRGRESIVLKILENANDRASRGHVATVNSSEAGMVFRRMQKTGKRIWAEELVSHGTDQYFLGLLWLGHQERPLLMVSGNAGSGFEARARGTGLVESCEIEAGRHIDPTTLPILAATPGLAELGSAAESVFETIGGIALELNPVVRDSAGRFVPLDAKAFVDPYGPSATLATEEDPESAERMLEFAPLLGEVGLLSIGAGLTRAVIDWLSYAGGGAACFSDLIPAVLADVPDLLSGRPGIECVRSTAWLCRWLQLTNRNRLLVTLVSGGTPIDALSRSVLQGISNAGWAGTTVAFVAGNRSAAAAEVWSSSGFRCEATLDAAIRAVVS